MIGCEDFDESSQNFITVFAIEGQRELCGEQAVFYTEVVAPPVEFSSEVAFALRELCECGAEVDGVLAALRFFKLRGEDAMD